MADQSDNSINPLFNKMNALMARHRGGAQQKDDDIPVLTQETIAPAIPVLLEEVPLPTLTLEATKLASGLMFDPKEAPATAHVQAKTKPAAPAGLMFDPEEFLRPPPAPELLVEEKPAPEPEPEPEALPAEGEPLFMDLPLLDLDSLSTTAFAAPPAIAPIPAVAAQPPSDITLAFDLEVLSAEENEPAPAADELELDVARQVDAWGIPIEESNSKGSSPVPSTTTDETPACTPGEPLLASAHEDTLPVTNLAEPPCEPTPPGEAEIPVAATSAPEELAATFPALPVDTEPLDSHYWSLDETELGSSEPIDLLVEPGEPEDELTYPAMVAPTAPNEDAAHPDPAFWGLGVPAQMIEASVKETDQPTTLIWEDPESGDILSIEAGPEEDISSLLGESHINDIPVVVAPAPAPPEPARLSDADVQELSAMVGAHLAVEITAEVEQLTRQHFAKLMSSLYGDTLRQLTDAVCSELEAKIGERIVDLVQSELKDRGLIDQP